jgi:hypothetical protein
MSAQDVSSASGARTQRLPNEVPSPFGHDPELPRIDRAQEEPRSPTPYEPSPFGDDWPVVQRTSPKERARLERSRPFPLLDGLLDGPWLDRIAAFRKDGHALELAEIAIVTDRLLDLDPAQLNQLRDALIRLPEPHRLYGVIRRNKGDRGVASVEQILRILSGEAAGLGTLPVTVDELGRSIAAKETELGRMHAEQFALEGTTPSTRIADLDKELEALREARQALSSIRRLSTLEQAGVTGALAIKVGIPGVVSLTLEKTESISKVDRRTNRRVTKGYTSAAIKGAYGYVELVFDGLRKPTLSWGATAGLPYTVYSKNHPAYGDRVGIWIPLVMQAEISSRGSVGGMIVTPSVIPGLHIGWTLYVEHPAFAKVTTPIFGAVERAISAAKRGLSSLRKPQPAIA